MKRQSKVKYQKPSDFFADGRAARPPVDGNIPIGYDFPGNTLQNAGEPNDITSPLGEFSAGTDYYNTGKMGQNWGTGMPEQIPISADLLKRGQEEFQVNCAVCHGATGQGNGITSKYGLLGIANYHQNKYRHMPDAHPLTTIPHANNTMFSTSDTAPD